MRRSWAVLLAAAFFLSGCSAPLSVGTTRTSEESPGVAVYTPPPTLRPATPAPVKRPPKKTAFSILDDLMFEAVSAKYRAVGVPLIRGDYDRLSEDVCKDMRAGGAGYFTIGDVSRLSESGKETLARSMWLVFAPSCYPDDHVLSDADMDAIAEMLADQAPEYQRRLNAAGLSTPSSDSSSLYGESNDGYSYPSRGPSSYSGGYSGSGSGSSGGGHSTMCNDGTVSQSGGKRGACSHHGGVSK